MVVRMVMIVACGVESSGCAVLEYRGIAQIVVRVVGKM